MTASETPRRYRQKIRFHERAKFRRAYGVWIASCECGRFREAASHAEAISWADAHRAEHVAVCPLRRPS